MARALWTPHAAGELDDILFYISVRDRRPLIGEQIYFEIRQLADDYASPHVARHVLPGSPPRWYYFRHKRWLIFYQLHPEGIEVMRVLDGSRDLPAILS
jgi:plasmid stabilization system protein ParE